jgi:hypothetical protein
MLYLATKPSHVGANVDGLACSLHRPLFCNHQRGGQCCLTGDALSRRTMVDGGAFLRGGGMGAKPLGLDI